MILRNVLSAFLGALVLLPGVVVAQAKSGQDQLPLLRLEIAKPESRKTKKAPLREAKPTIDIGAPGTSPSGSLSRDQLLAMLKAMGHEEAKIDEQGDIPVQVGQWWIWVRRSDDNASIWLMAGLSKVENVAHATGEKLLPLLEANNTTDATIIYFPESRWLYMQKHMPNNNVTPALLLRSLTSMSNMLGRTEPLWRAENFAK